MTWVSTAGRRACALLAAGSAGLHVAMLGHAANIVTAGLLAAMAVACGYCAVELWQSSTVRAWVVVGLMNLAMIAIHLPAPSHHHVGGSPSEPPTLMQVATAVAMVEVLAAGAALYARSRISDTPGR